jgi:hypothetical protein
MFSGRTMRAVVLALVGLAGVFLGHLAGYWLTHPDAHERAIDLVRTGHGYWFVVSRVVALGAFAAALGQTALGFGDQRRSGQGAPSRLELWVRLSVVQVATFGIMELLERLSSLEGAGHLLTEPAFLVALPIQVLIAAGGAFLLWFLHVTGTKLACRSAPWLTPRTPSRTRAMFPAFRALSPDPTPRRTRAPPRPSQ